MNKNIQQEDEQALKQLDQIFDTLTTEESKGISKKSDILKKCFERARVPIPRYKSFMAKENFFNFNKGDILTFRLIETPILKDLGVYLVGIGNKLFISYYNEESNSFIIDDTLEPIHKKNATIEGVLTRLEKGGTNE